MPTTQATRSLAVSTPLDDDVLLLTAFRGHEQVSGLFNFELEMLSDDPSINPKELIGKEVGFRVARKEGEPRHFHGIIKRFVAGDEVEDDRRAYRAEIVPWLWFLTRTSDCRIFQEMTAPEIIEQIFKDLGFDASRYDLFLNGSYTKRTYCVQYRETDFNFVSRLMEEEGIYYFFKHEEDNHTLVISDVPHAYFDCEESVVDFPRDETSIHIGDHLTGWQHHYAYRSGHWTHTDYNFETPSTSLKSDTATVVEVADNKKYEFYDYPGLYEDRGAGIGLVGLRMEEEEAGYDSVEGTSQCRTFAPGARFRVGRHRSASEEGHSYVILSVHHSGSELAGYESGWQGESDYRNSFRCIPDSVVFRPNRLTPKPVVQGMQTAVVVGPAGEEIYCDRYGRVKVQFHWDREGKKNEESSCWIRAAQSSAGRQWGFVALPRIGQEVVVSFLEGDPDRPLIIGGVYNAEQMPHYELPNHMTRTYLKTNSSKSGDGYNELMFEDKMGDERVFVHAEHNMDVRVKNDSKSRIYGNRHQIIGWEKDGRKGGTQRELVHQDKHIHVKGAHFEHIDGSVEWLVGHGDNPNGGNLDIVVEKQKSELIEADSHLQIKGDHRQKTDGTYSLVIGGDQQNKVGGNIAMEAGSAGEVHIKAGMKVIIEAGVQISLKGPGGFVDIGPAGVTIQGTMVKINSGGSAGSGKGCKPASPEDPKQAKPDDPAVAFDSKTGHKSSPD